MSHLSSFFIRWQAPGVVLVDASGGFAPVALQAGLPLLAEKVCSALSLLSCVTPMCWAARLFRRVSL